MSRTTGELSIQDIFRDSPNVLSSDVANLRQAALGQECKHSWDACLVEDVVWCTILLRDTQNSLEVAQGNGVEPAFLAKL